MTTDTDTGISNRDASAPEPMRLAGLAAGASDTPEWGVKERAVDFYDVKGEIEALLAPLRASFAPAQHPALHPGRCAQIMLSGVAVGFVGELHPKWRQSYELSHAPILFELDLGAVLTRPVPSSKPVPKFQAVERDIAVLVDEHITHDALIHAIWAAPTEGALRDALLFDIYRPKSAEASAAKAPEKSMAVRLTLNGQDAALTEAQIESAVASIIATLSAQVGARQRT